MIKFRPRRLQQSGGSHYVVLPPEWRDAQLLRKGDLVQFVLDDDGRLTLQKAGEA